MSIQFTVNGAEVDTDEDPNMPLLWFLRDTLNLKGTKFGCGISACGACTVHIDGEPVRSCVFPLAASAGKRVTTIEGLAGTESEPVQQAWVKVQVPQCGYCQSGMIMTVTALLKKNSAPTDEDINQAVTNICRCGTYPRIRKAIHLAAESKAAGNGVEGGA